MNNANYFKLKLNKLMKENRISQADLSRVTGIPTSLISNYVTGKKSPALSNAKIISDALGVSMDELAGNMSHFDERLTEEEKELIELYRNATGRAKELARMALDAGQEENKKGA